MKPLLTKEEWQQQRKGCSNLHQGTQDAEWCVIEENGMKIKGYCGYYGCHKVTGREP